MAGQAFALTRQGRPAGRCTVETVSDRSATCTGQDLRPGDTFALAAPPGTPPPPSAQSTTPALAGSEVVRLRGALEAAPLPKVVFVAPPQRELARGPQRLEASLLHASFFARGASGLAQERLELRGYGLELTPGWRLFVDASAVYRPTASSERFRSGDSAYLEVRELQVASREADRAYTLAVGRVFPWSAPGATSFDGAQVGLRGRAGEVGVFGGAVPDVVTTAVGTSRATGGVYGALEHASEAVLLRGEARLAVVRSPELGTRTEVEALGHAWLSRSIDLSAQARLGLGGDRTAPASLDAARLDVSTRLAEPLWLTGSLRYVGLYIADPAAPALFPNPARHADLTASWDVTRRVVVRLTGGYAKDLTTGLDRGYAGPEVALPRLLGRYGSLAAGWLEERGWAAGRSLWVQGETDALLGARLLLRGSFYMDRQPAPLADARTVGLLASATKDLASWLRFRVSALGRVDASSEGGSSPAALSLLAGLDGRALSATAAQPITPPRGLFPLARDPRRRRSTLARRPPCFSSSLGRSSPVCPASSPAVARRRDCCAGSTRAA